MINQNNDYNHHEEVLKYSTECSTLVEKKQALSTKFFFNNKNECSFSDTNRNGYQVKKLYFFFNFFYI